MAESPGMLGEGMSRLALAARQSFRARKKNPKSKLSSGPKKRRKKKKKEKKKRKEAKASKGGAAFLQ